MTSNAEYASQIRKSIKHGKISIRELSRRTGIPAHMLIRYMSENENIPLAEWGVIASAIEGTSAAFSQDRGVDIAGEGADLVILRLMSLLHVTTDTALAKVLGVSKQTISAWRTRESIPFNICIDVVRMTGASLDYLIFGKGAGSLPPGQIGEPAPDTCTVVDAKDCRSEVVADMELVALFEAALSKFGVPRLIDVDEGPLSPSGYKIKAEITLQMLPPENASAAPDQE